MAPLSRPAPAAPGPPRPDTSGLVEAMCQPSFYPHQPPSVELIETHISWVFLAGERVYKVKKPVVFPFLDYGSPERRLLMCREEVRLNRRLAPDLYLGVRGVSAVGGRWALTDAGDPDVLEYAVEMRRLDEDQTLARLLERKAARIADVAAVGERLARFHLASPRAHGAGESSQARRIDENFESLLEFVPELLAPRELAAAQRFAASFLSARGGELDRRAEAGLVREGHGDLRAEHVLVSERGVEVFDCIEFARELREIDVGADLAFLVMDLEARGSADLARVLVGAYRGSGGNPGDDALVAFFAAYRAWVRAKVACLRWAELEPGDPRREAAEAEARGLAAVGRTCAWHARGPLLIVACGGTASGKTYLASHLARAASLPHLNSDPVRKQLLGLAPTDRAPAEAYTDELNARTYDELGRRAGELVGTGGGAVVDATFRHRGDRARFAAALGEVPVTPVFIECRAPLELLERRARERMRDRERVSDAEPALVAAQQREFEPLDEVPSQAHLVVRTDRPVLELADDVEALLDARLAAGESDRTG